MLSEGMPDEYPKPEVYVQRALEAASRGDAAEVARLRRELAELLGIRPEPGREHPDVPSYMRPKFDAAANLAASVAGAPDADRKTP